MASPALRTSAVIVSVGLDVPMVGIDYPPAMGARAFEVLFDVLDGKGIPKEAMKAIFDFFVSHFIRKLDDYYRPLNVALESQGIRPGIEDEIRSRGSLLKTGSAARPEAREAEPEQAPAVREEPEPAPEAPPGQNLAEQVPDVEDDTLLGQAARLTGGEAAPERPKPAAVSPAPAGATKPARARAEAGSGQAKYQSVINALNALRDPEALAASLSSIEARADRLPAMRAAASRSYDQNWSREARLDQWSTLISDMAKGAS